MVSIYSDLFTICAHFHKHTYTCVCSMICWLQYMLFAVQIMLKQNSRYGFGRVLLHAKTYHGGNNTELFLRDLVADKSVILFITFLYIEK